MAFQVPSKLIVVLPGRLAMRWAAGGSANAGRKNRMAIDAAMILRRMRSLSTPDECDLNPSTGGAVHIRAGPQPAGHPPPYRSHKPQDYSWEDSLHPRLPRLSQPVAGLD